MVVRLALMVLWIAVLLNLIMGMLFWTGNAGSLVPAHMALGILVVLSLWTLGVAQALTPGGSWGMALGAVVFGMVLAVSGGIQEELFTSSLHSIMPVLHLFLGILALGVGHLMRGRARRMAAQAAV